MTSSLALLTIVLVPARVGADDEDLELRLGSLDGWSPPVGLTMIGGAGVTGFTSAGMRDTLTSSVATLWSVRVTLGSQTGLGVEAGFARTTASIRGLTGLPTGALVGSTFEGALRYNLRPDASWNPYLSAGIGWQRYDVEDAPFTMAVSVTNDRDDAVVFPIALGLAYRPARSLVLDVHGTVRPNATGELVLDQVGEDERAPMHTWELGAAVGFDL